MQYYIGIDIGGTKCACTVGEVSKDQINIIEKKKILTDTSLPYLNTLNQISDIIEVFIQKYPIASIGISCGGPLNSKKGLILSPPNLPGWDEVPICDFYQKKYNIRCSLQNDANACAVAEWKYGAGKDTSNMIFCTMGTGFGAGLILDGKLYSGTNDFAGEIGHIRLENFGPVGYGKIGSIEGFCSGGGIAQTAASFAREIIQKGRKCAYCDSISHLDKITCAEVAMAALNGDETAKRVFSFTGTMLGKALSIVIDLLNPQLIVIGSIYNRCSQLISDSMNTEIIRETLPYTSKVCRVLPAELGEDLGDYAAIAVASL